MPGVEELANVRGVQVCNISSTEMTSAYWVQMAKTINELAEDETVSGFVVTHGTDTLDETAYFLHLACKTDKPVVVTGAMRPATATSADGPMNLYQSIALAASPEAMGRGTMVVFSDGIYCGRDVQKVSTFRCDAFNSKDMGFLGYIQDANVHFYNSSDRAHSTATEFDVSGIDELPKVGVLYSNVGADAELVDAMLGLGVKGIVLCGSGAGGNESGHRRQARRGQRRRRPSHLLLAHSKRPHRRLLRQAYPRRQSAAAEGRHPARPRPHRHGRQGQDRRDGGQVLI